MEKITHFLFSIEFNVFLHFALKARIVSMSPSKLWMWPKSMNIRTKMKRKCIDCYENINVMFHTDPKRRKLMSKNPHEDMENLLCCTCIANS